MIDPVARPEQVIEAIDSRYESIELPLNLEDSGPMLAANNPRQHLEAAYLLRHLANLRQVADRPVGVERCLIRIGPPDAPSGRLPVLRPGNEETTVELAVKHRHKRKPIERVLFVDLPNHLWPMSRRIADTSEQPAQEVRESLML